VVKISSSAQEFWLWRFVDSSGTAGCKPQPDRDILMHYGLRHSFETSVFYETGHGPEGRTALPLPPCSSPIRCSVESLGTAEISVPEEPLDTSTVTRLFVTAPECSADSAAPECDSLAGPMETSARGGVGGRALLSLRVEGGDGVGAGKSGWESENGRVGSGREAEDAEPSDGREDPA
jgi:hypothetical protein